MVSGGVCCSCLFPTILTEPLCLPAVLVVIRNGRIGGIFSSVQALHAKSCSRLFLTGRGVCRTRLLLAIQSRNMFLVLHTLGGWSRRVRLMVPGALHWGRARSRHLSFLTLLGQVHRLLLTTRGSSSKARLLGLHMQTCLGQCLRSGRVCLMVPGAL
jgi:hypothetical protein